MPLKNKKRKMDSISPFEKGEKGKCDSTVAEVLEPISYSCVANKNRNPPNKPQH